MRVFKTIGYIFAIIGLFIALLLLVVPILYLFSLFLDSYDAQTAADLTHTAISALILYKLNTKLCNLLETVSSATAGCIATFIVFWVLYAFFPLGAFPVVAFMLALVAPPVKKRKELKQEVIIAPKSRICPTCKRINDPDANFCTNCGSGLMK